MKWHVQDDEVEDEEPRYSNIIYEEEYEEDDPPEGFSGHSKGSSIDEEPSRDTVRPWDPTEVFFIII